MLPGQHKITSVKVWVKSGTNTFPSAATVVASSYTVWDLIVPKIVSNILNISIFLRFSTHFDHSFALFLFQRHLLTPFKLFKQEQNKGKKKEKKKANSVISNVLPPRDSSFLDHLKFSTVLHVTFPKFAFLLVVQSLNWTASQIACLCTCPNAVLDAHMDVRLFFSERWTAFYNSLFDAD